MKTASAEFKDQLAVDSTTLCRLIRISPRGRAIMRFTDHDRDIEYDSETYVSTGAPQCSAIDNQIGGARTNFDLTALLGGEFIRGDLERGIYDGAFVEIDYIFYDHTDYGVMPTATGEVTSVSVPHMTYGVMSCSGIVSQTQHILTEQFTATCRAEFCDARCSLDIEDFGENITVDAVAGLGQFTASEVAAHADGFYDLGVLTWLTGDNEGQSIEVRRSLATGSVALMVQSGYVIQVGDTARIYRGCDKTLAACTGYANKLNFRGEPYVPGDDFVEAPEKANPPVDAGTPPTPQPPGWFPVPWPPP